jgi:hypothetical protein
MHQSYEDVVHIQHVKDARPLREVMTKMTLLHVGLKPKIWFWSSTKSNEFIMMGEDTAYRHIPFLNPLDFKHGAPDFGCCKLYTLDILSANGLKQYIKILPVTCYIMEIHRCKFSYFPTSF